MFSLRLEEFESKYFEHATLVQICVIDTAAGWATSRN
jgi:hypothetical protein